MTVESEAFSWTVKLKNDLLEIYGEFKEKFINVNYKNAALRGAIRRRVWKNAICVASIVRRKRKRAVKKLPKSRRVCLDPPFSF